MMILTIVGPTAVGKTSFAIRIAKKISGEIISADSRQIYKYLDIGTAKPTNKERKMVNFYLIDFVNPDDIYSCGQFARDAEAKIEYIKKKKKVPIICGGTGLYIKALFDPLHKLPESDKAIKQKLLAELHYHGIDHLYKQLSSIDSEWAKKIGSKDKQRILRGLEVYEITGKPLSKLIKMNRAKAKFFPYYVGLNIPRTELYEKIDQRFDNMIRNGLVKEVKALLKKGYDPQANALRTIGYKEITAYLKGDHILSEAIDKAKKRTRNFARRQITWFNKIPDIKWFDPKEPNLVGKIANRLKREF
jgi:tRNA dimethylallyltransferase